MEETSEELPQVDPVEEVVRSLRRGRLYRHVQDVKRLLSNDESVVLKHEITRFSFEVPDAITLPFETGVMVATQAHKNARRDAINAMLQQVNDRDRKKQVMSACTELSRAVQKGVQVVFRSGECTVELTGRTAKA